MDLVTLSLARAGGVPLQHLSSPRTFRDHDAALTLWQREEERRARRAAERAFRRQARWADFGRRLQSLGRSLENLGSRMAQPVAPQSCS